MRAIKFRAWYEGDKRMIYDTCKCKNHSGIIMQFTGLVDKNGVEIYEGDVVILSGQNNFEFSIRCQIIYEESSCQFGALNDTGNEYFELCSGDRYSIDEIKVIGNIYQNPELIKGANDA